MGTATADDRSRHRLPGSLTAGAAVAVAALIAAVFLVLNPHTVDLAAHVYRSQLFSREGFTIWDAGWYGGHHTPAYSVLFPPLGALLGAAVAGAVSAVAAAALFEPLARTRLAALWFAAGTATLLFTGRMPFALGVALGLAALVALKARRPVAAGVLAAACALASPVAGAFLALVAVALASEPIISGTADRSSRRGSRMALVVVIAALAPIAILAIAFPEGGYEPFTFSSYVAIPLFAVAALLLLDPAERALRIGVVLYLIAGTAAYLIHTPMGGNAARLGALFAGPVLAGAALRGPRAAILVVFAALAFWQFQPAVRDTRKAYEDPSSRASFYTPLNHQLERRERPPARVEVVFTRSHWEAAEVAPHMPLARGWERQLDIARNPIFYKGPLNSTTYARWLADNGVRWVALADTTPDYSSYRERALIERGLPYLRQVWRSRHWRLYEVTEPHPLAVGGRVLRWDNSSVTLAAPRAGAPITVKVAWSPYWRAPAGCVERAGGWTRVTPRRAGIVKLEIDFSLARVVNRGRRCG